MRILTHIIGDKDDGRLLGRVASTRFALSHHLFRKLKMQNAILLDGVSARANVRVKSGQTITLHIEDAALAGDVSLGTHGNIPEINTTCASPAGKANCVYRDEDFLVLDKAAPLPTLPSRHTSGETLRDQVRMLLGITEPFCFHTVNRLDKGTSGLLCVALNPHAKTRLASTLHTQSFIREYLAITEGIPQEESGVIDAPIARAEGQVVKRCVADGGLCARTHYAVLQVCDTRALLRLRLETGRTHQIRVHLAHIGCPIIGDYLYGEEDPSLHGRFALHSAHIAFTQPITGQAISVDSPLPDALLNLLRPIP